MVERLRRGSCANDSQYSGGGARKFFKQFAGERANVFESICSRVNQQHWNPKLR